MLFMMRYTVCSCRQKHACL